MNEFLALDAGKEHHRKLAASGESWLARVDRAGGK